MTLPTRGIEAREGLEFDKFIESAANPGQFGVVVLDSAGNDISGGGGGGGGAVSVADGADVAEGATTDTAVAAGAAGTISAKMRRLTTDLDAVKTSVNTVNTTLGHLTDNTQTTRITDGANTAGVDATNGLKVLASSVQNGTWSVTATQGTAANLKVEPTQLTAANLQMTANQGTPANLKMEPTQLTAANMQVTANQATAANLNATVVQGTAANLKCEPTQNTAANLQMTANQATAANLKCEPTQTTSSNLKAQVEGLVAHDAVDSGNPEKIGGIAADPTSLPTAVSVADRVNACFSTQGELFVYLTRLLEGEDSSNHLMGMLPKPIAGNTYTNSAYQNNSFTTQNVKATAGNLLSFRVLNTTASTRYLQFHNTATTPGGGATAQEKFLVPANSQIVIGPADLGAAGLYFSTGIAVGNSSAAGTYTAGSAGDLLVDLVYV